MCRWNGGYTRSVVVSLVMYTVSSLTTFVEQILHQDWLRQAFNENVALIDWWATKAYLVILANDCTHLPKLNTTALLDRVASGELQPSQQYQALLLFETLGVISQTDKSQLLDKVEKSVINTCAVEDIDLQRFIQFGEQSMITSSASQVVQLWELFIHEHQEQFLALLYSHPRIHHFEDLLLPRLDTKHYYHAPSLVMTVTTRSNLRLVADAVLMNRSVIFTGEEGCGKNSLITEVASMMGYQSQIIRLQLNDQSDSRALLGSYVCSEVPGEFKWQPGVITNAVTHGYWIILQNIDMVPLDVIASITSLLESGKLTLPQKRKSIKAHPKFRIFATRSILPQHKFTFMVPHLRHLSYLWHYVHLETMTVEEKMTVLAEKVPNVPTLYTQKMVTLATIHQLEAIKSTSISFRKLLQLARRISEYDLAKRSYVTDEMKFNVFLDFVDIFCAASRTSDAFLKAVRSLGHALSLSDFDMEHALVHLQPEIQQLSTSVRVGRITISVSQSPPVQSNTFAQTKYARRLLEKIAAAVKMNEPVLLVGETGTGKTTSVQELAQMLGKILLVHNLSLSTDAGDLVGGYRPSTIRELLLPLYESFVRLFKDTMSAAKNMEFLQVVADFFQAKKWQKLLQSFVKGCSSAIKKLEKLGAGSEIQQERLVLWQELKVKSEAMLHNLAKFERGFAFRIIRGFLVQAFESGGWILLDEINLAAAETLQSLSPFLLSDQEEIMVEMNGGELTTLKRHPDFRIFAAMNPPTDICKKELPHSIRSKFTELYVDEMTDSQDLLLLIEQYLHGIQDSAASDVVDTYLGCRAVAEVNLTDGSGQRPRYSLRSLTRSLKAALTYSHLGMRPFRRCLFEGFLLNFQTQLSERSKVYMYEYLLRSIYPDGDQKNLSFPASKPTRGNYKSKNWILFKPFWLPCGAIEPIDWTEKNAAGFSRFVVTATVNHFIRNLAAALSASVAPILIQGPTSIGKTTLIQYMAAKLGHKCFRINNHEHTDVQEYVGGYVSGTDGALTFQEGILVQALRGGHWIILDELNLAPSEILEALNRLLDDNRELLIPETGEVIRPSEGFQLFATQNPPGIYGGRKPLSLAFRNRFIELNFDDIPSVETEEIVTATCGIAPKYSKMMIKVSKDLQIQRQKSALLLGKQGIITLRDMLKWGNRKPQSALDVACIGYALLCERTRTNEEKAFVQGIIESVCRVTIPLAQIYSNVQALAALQQSLMAKSVLIDGISSLAITHSFNRMYTLLSSALDHREPVLLVGETGAGKTMSCQLYAASSHLGIRILNCHQSTEAADIIGSLRPVRNREGLKPTAFEALQNFFQLVGDEHLLARLDEDIKSDVIDYNFWLETLAQTNATGDFQVSHLQVITTLTELNQRSHALFEWVDGPLVECMKNGYLFVLDEINLAEDAVIERLNSVLEARSEITLAEKPGAEAEVIRPHENFRIVATMNPGGDFGKRELSPALRSRFTEVWIPNDFSAEERRSIVETYLNTTIEDSLKQTLASRMVEFTDILTSSLARICSVKIQFTSRDIISWAKFINITAGDSMIGLYHAFVHGAFLTFIDGLAMIPSIGSEQLQAVREKAFLHLTSFITDGPIRLQVQEAVRILVDADRTLSYNQLVQKDASKLSVAGYSLPINELKSAVSTYHLLAPNVVLNLGRILRAMQINRPILLEGPPGVGKTSLITTLSKISGHELVRINLSEQTELSDLLGSDLPVADADNDSEDSNAARFRWYDGVLLTAMKLGQWVLLDELNLAQQTVLEGLNACFDHRGQVFLPEIGQTVLCAPSFRIFCAQNPLKEGGGRKGLPASFLSRMTRVVFEALNEDDLVEISSNAVIANDSIPVLDRHHLQKMVQFIQTLTQASKITGCFGRNGSPWEFNLRDVTKWREIASIIDAKYDVADGFEQLFRIGTAAYYLFSQRMRDVGDKKFIADAYRQIFDADLCLGSHVIRSYRAVVASSSDKSKTAMALRLAVELSYPVLLTGPQGSGKKQLITETAQSFGKALRYFSAMQSLDSAELLGTYGQSTENAVFEDLSNVFHEILSVFTRHQLMQPEANCDHIVNIAESLANAECMLGAETLLIHFESLYQVCTEATNLLELSDNEGKLIPPLLENASSLIRKLQEPSKKSKFEWNDGVVIEAITRGDWLLIDNVNLAASSVLDRLNSLMEPGGSILLTEDGSGRNLFPHPDFRIFLVMDPSFGEISRAMRNRCLEIYHTFSPGASIDSMEGNALTSIARKRIIDECLSLNQVETMSSRAMHLTKMVDAFPSQLLSVSLARVFKIIPSTPFPTAAKCTNSEMVNCLIDSCLVDLKQASLLFITSLQQQKLPSETCDVLHSIVGDSLLTIDADVGSVGHALLQKLQSIHAVFSETAILSNNAHFATIEAFVAFLLVTMHPLVSQVPLSFISDSIKMQMAHLQQLVQNQRTTITMHSRSIVNLWQSLKLTLYANKLVNLSSTDVSLFYNGRQVLSLLSYGSILIQEQTKISSCTPFHRFLINAVHLVQTLDGYHYDNKQVTFLKNDLLTILMAFTVGRETVTLPETQLYAVMQKLLIYAHQHNSALIDIVNSTVLAYLEAIGANSEAISIMIQQPAIISTRWHKVTQVDDYVSTEDGRFVVCNQEQRARTLEIIQLIAAAQHLPDPRQRIIEIVSRRNSSLGNDQVVQVRVSVESVRDALAMMEITEQDTYLLTNEAILSTIMQDQSLSLVQACTIGVVQSILMETQNLLLLLQSSSLDMSKSAKSIPTIISTAKRMIYSLASLSCANAGLMTDLQQLIWQYEKASKMDILAASTDLNDVAIDCIYSLNILQQNMQTLLDSQAADDNEKLKGFVMHIQGVKVPSKPSQSYQSSFIVSMQYKPTQFLQILKELTVNVSSIDIDTRVLCMKMLQTVNHSRQIVQFRSKLVDSMKTAIAFTGNQLAHSDCIIARNQEVVTQILQLVTDNLQHHQLQDFSSALLRQFGCYLIMLGLVSLHVHRPMIPVDPSEASASYVQMLQNTIDETKSICYATGLASALAGQPIVDELVYELALSVQVSTSELQLESQSIRERVNVLGTYRELFDFMKEQSNNTFDLSNMTSINRLLQNIDDESVLARLNNWKDSANNIVNILQTQFAAFDEYTKVLSFDLMNIANGVELVQLSKNASLDQKVICDHPFLAALSSTATRYSGLSETKVKLENVLFSSLQSLARVNVWSTEHDLVLRYLNITPVIKRSTVDLVINAAIKWWHDTEEKRKQKEIAEQSMYKNNLIEVDDKHVEEMEFRKRFPNHATGIFDSILNNEERDNNLMEEDNHITVSEVAQASALVTVDVLQLFSATFREALLHSAQASVLPIQTQDILKIELNAELQFLSLIHNLVPYVLHPDAVIASNNLALSGLVAMYLGAQPKKLLSTEIAIDRDLLYLLDSQRSTYTLYRPRDIQRDPFPEEVTQALPSLLRIHARCVDILRRYPGNEILIRLIRMVSQIQQFPMTKTPLSKMLMSFQLLLKCMQDWEGVAASFVSLADEMKLVSKLIIQWRTHEFKSWEDMLRIEEIAYVDRAVEHWFSLLKIFRIDGIKKCSKDARKDINALSWLATPPIQNGVYDEAFESYLSQILKTVDTFLRSSSVGEFPTRLHMIRAIALMLLEPHENQIKPTPEQQRVSKLILGTWQLFSQYLVDTRRFQDLLRKPLLQRVKDEVKLGKWDDLNVYALLENSDKMHRKISKIVREYHDEVLEFPIQSLILRDLSKGMVNEAGELIPSVDIPDDKQLYPLVEKAKDMQSMLTFLSKQSFSSKEQIIAIESEVTIPTQLTQLPSLLRKTNNYMKSLFDLSYWSNSNEDENQFATVAPNTINFGLSVADLAESLSDEIFERIATLRGPEVKRNAKQKAVRDLMENLHAQGFQSLNSTVPHQLRSNIELLSTVQYLPSLLAYDLSFEGGEVMRNLLEKSEHYHVRNLVELTQLRTQVVSVHSSDVSHRDVMNMQHFVESMMLQSMIGRVALDKSIGGFIDLRTAMAKLQSCSAVLNSSSAINTRFATLDAAQKATESIHWGINHVIKSLTRVKIIVQTVLEAHQTVDKIEDIPVDLLRSFSTGQMQGILSAISQAILILQESSHLPSYDDNHVPLSLTGAALLGNNGKLLLADAAWFERASGNAIQCKTLLDSYQVELSLIVGAERFVELNHLLTCIEEESSGNSSCASNNVQSIETFTKAAVKAVDKVRVTVQRLRALIPAQQDNDTDDNESNIVSLMKQSCESLETIQVSTLTAAVDNFCHELLQCSLPGNSQLLSSLTQQVLNMLTSVTSAYSILLDEHILALKSHNKLQYIVLRVFRHLLAKGLCARDQEEEEGDGNGGEGSGDKMTFEDDVEGTGMGEGQGKKDVSDQIDNEEQLLGNKQDKLNELDNKDPQNSNKQPPLTKEEQDKGVEMNADFDGDMFDLNQDEQEEQDDDNDDDQEDDEKSLDREIGDADLDDIVDERQWGSDDELDDKDDDNDDGKEQEKFEKGGKMTGDALEDEMHTKQDDEKEKDKPQSKDEPSDKKQFKPEPVDNDQAEEEGGEIGEAPEEMDRPEGAEHHHNNLDDSKDAAGEEDDDGEDLPDDMQLDGEGENDEEADDNRMDDDEDDNASGNDSNDTDAENAMDGIDDDQGSEEGSDDDLAQPLGGAGTGPEQEQPEEEQDPANEMQEDHPQPPPPPQATEKNKKKPAAYGNAGQGDDDILNRGEEDQLDKQQQPRQSMAMEGEDDGHEGNAEQKQQQQGGDRGQGLDASENLDINSNEQKGKEEWSYPELPNPLLTSGGDPLKAWFRRLQMLDDPTAADDLMDDANDDSNQDVQDEQQQPVESKGQFEFTNDNQVSATQVLGRQQKNEAASIPTQKSEEEQATMDEEDVKGGTYDDHQDEQMQKDEETESIRNKRKLEEKEQEQAPSKRNKSQPPSAKEKNKEKTTAKNKQAQQAEQQQDDAMDVDDVEDDSELLTSSEANEAEDPVDEQQLKQRQGIYTNQQFLFSTALALDDEVTNVTMDDEDNEGAGETATIAFQQLTVSPEARYTWQRHRSLTETHATRLSEQLRLILEPTLRSRLQGDYRTGKRLNLRKIIPYIASGYRKDKIWLRRSKPAGRAYQIMVLLDDSQSMGLAGEMALASLTMLTTALQRLEVGEVSIAKFSDELTILHPFDTAFTGEEGGVIVENLSFEADQTHVAGALQQLRPIFNAARERQQSHGQGNTAILQLCFLISDARIDSENREKVQQKIRDLSEDHVLVILIILDCNASDKDSIFRTQTVSFVGGKVQTKSYFEDFPFPYYVAVRDVAALPELLADALRQWFELVQVQLTNGSMAR